MNAALLMINNERIALADDADIEALIEAISAAVDHGSGLVHVDGVRGEQYELFITPTTQVIVRHGVVEFESGPAVGPWTTSIDLDI